MHYQETILRFIKISVWLFNDAVKNRWKRLIIIVIASFIGTFTTATAFGILIGYAKYQIDGNTFQIKGVELPIMGGIEGLLLFGGLALIFGYASAYITYWSQKEILKFSQDYHKGVMARSVASYIKERHFNFSEDIRFLTNKHDNRHLPTIYSNYVSISLKNILDIIQPMIVLFGSSLILLYSNVKATLIISPLLFVYLAFVYKIGKKASTYQGDYLNRITKLNPHISDLRLTLMQNENPFYDKLLFKEYFHGLETDKLLSPWYGRILVAYQSNYLSQIFVILAMVLLFVYFGWATSTETTSWSAIVVFLVSLRFTGQSMQKVSALVVNVSKFYPSIRIFKEYVVVTENIVVNDYVKNDRVIEKLQNKVLDRSNLLPLSENIINLYCRQPSFILWYGKKNNPFASNKIKKSIVELLFEPKKVDPSEIYFHGAPKLIKGLTLAENAMGLNPQSTSIAKLMDYLKSLGVNNELNAFSKELHEECNEQTEKMISKEFIFAITTFYISLNYRPILIFECDSYFTLNIEFQKKCLKYFSENIILFCSNNAQTALNMHDELSFRKNSQFIVLSNNKLIFIGNRTLISCQLENISNHANEITPKEDSNSDEFALDDDSIF